MRRWLPVALLFALFAVLLCTLRLARARALLSNDPTGTAQSVARAGSEAVPAERTLRTVVIDPAHGGADEGAHGASGVLEKDAVLALAQVVAAALRQQGLRVVLTRQGDEDPSFDDRAAVANAQPGAIFLTLHVSSTGPTDTARVFYYDFNELAPPNTVLPPGMTPWRDAQRGWTNLSQRLAQLLQVEFAERFRGSPELPSGAAVYQLRLIAAPAVAVEISSVDVPNEAALEAMAPPLTSAVVQGVSSFRPVYEGSVK